MLLTALSAVQATGSGLSRDNIVIYEGKLSSLKRFKDDVRKSRQDTNAASQ